MSPFKPINRHTSYLFPPSVDDWLPEQHLARFVVDVVEQLDLKEMERATYDSVAFRYVAANEHPDHDTLNTFRKRFLPQIEGLMVQVLLIAQAMKLVSLGHIALDGTKVKANASRHSALSYGHSEKLEQQLREEVARFTEPPPLATDATPTESMRHRLKTKEGRALYAQRKCTVEPVIGIIKSVLGFRQFLLRGLDNVKGEWDLVALAWNLKRMHILTG